MLVSLIISLYHKILISTALLLAFISGNGNPPAVFYLRFLAIFDPFHCHINSRICLFTHICTHKHTHTADISWDCVEFTDQFGENWLLERFNRHLMKENFQMTNKCINTSLLIREIQIKNHSEILLHVHQNVQNDNLRQFLNVGKNVEQLEFSENVI